MLSAAERSGKIKTENCPQELFQTVLGPKARLQQIWNNYRLFSNKFQNDGKEGVDGEKHLEQCCFSSDWMGETSPC